MEIYWIFFVILICRLLSWGEKEPHLMLHNSRYGPATATPQLLRGKLGNLSSV